MDWIFENLGKIITALITIVYVLGSLRGSAKDEEKEEQQDPEALARARRIQEEIRRKILERQRGAAPQPEPVEEPEPYGEGPYADMYPPAAPAPELARADDVDEWSSEPWRPARPEPQPEPARPFLHYSPEDNEDGGEDPFEEQRRQIEAQLSKARSLKARVRSAKRDASAADYKRAYRREAADPSLLRVRIKRDMADPASLRAAFVLKELLDKPLALR